MKKVFFIILSAFILLAGCSKANDTKNTEGSPTASAPTETAKVSGKKLILATSADFKPFEYHDTSSGNDTITGFDIDVMKAVAQKLNVELDIRDMGFDGLLSSLQAKRADFVVAALNPTEERKKNVDFSDKYYTTKFAVLFPKGKSFKTLSELKDLKVGVQLGSVQETAAKAANLKTFPLNKFTDLIQELKAGRIDVLLAEQAAAVQALDTNPELDYNILPELKGIDVAIAFPKGSVLVADVNKAIMELQDSGDLIKIEDKWFK
jgi:arginine/lysine/histidine transporter system substrate-binding protein